MRFGVELIQVALLFLLCIEHEIQVIHSISLTSKKLDGKNVFVTGASGGIGASIAKRMAENGANVCVHYFSRREGAINTMEAIRSSNGKCEGIVKCDFRNPKDIDEMWENVISQRWNDKIDILVNNAGIVTKMAVEDDDNLNGYHETMAVNLHAPLQLSKLAYQCMKKRGGGNIVMNTSIHGTVSVEYMTAYAMSKAALDSLTKGLSNEWAGDGIRVNAVAPGIVPVERTRQVLDTPESQELWSKHLPVGRMGHVDDIADAVVYICQAEWMSGTIMTLDGGMIARSNMPFRARPPKTNNNEKQPTLDITSDVLFEDF